MRPILSRMACNGAGCGFGVFPQETIDELQAELAESRSIINALKNVKAA